MCLTAVFLVITFLTLFVCTKYTTGKSLVTSMAILMLFAI